MEVFDCKMIEVCPTSQQPMRGFADRLMAAEYSSARSRLSELPADHPGGGDPAVLSLSCVHVRRSSTVHAEQNNTNIRFRYNTNISKRPIPRQHICNVSTPQGFMAADVPDMGCQLLAVTDGDTEKAAKLAERFGMELFELRGQTRPQYLAVDAAIDAALAGPKPAVSRRRSA